MHKVATAMGKRTSGEWLENEVIPGNVKNMAIKSAVLITALMITCTAPAISGESAGFLIRSVCFCSPNPDKNQADKLCRPG